MPLPGLNKGVTKDPDPPLDDIVISPISVPDGTILVTTKTTNETIDNVDKLIDYVSGEASPNFIPQSAIENLTSDLGLFLPLAGGQMDNTANITLDDGSILDVNSVQFAVSTTPGINVPNIHYDGADMHYNAPIGSKHQFFISGGAQFTFNTELFDVMNHYISLNEFTGTIPSTVNADKGILYLGDDNGIPSLFFKEGMNISQLTGNLTNVGFVKFKSADSGLEPGATVPYIYYNEDFVPGRYRWNVPSNGQWEFLFSGGNRTLIDSEELDLTDKRLLGVNYFSLVNNANTVIDITATTVLMPNLTSSINFKASDGVGPIESLANINVYAQSYGANARGRFQIAVLSDAVGTSMIDIIGENSAANEDAIIKFGADISGTIIPWAIRDSKGRRQLVFQEDPSSDIDPLNDIYFVMTNAVETGPKIPKFYIEGGTSPNINMHIAAKGNGIIFMESDVSFDNAKRPVGMLDPINPQDGATKNYVDITIGGLGPFLPLAGNPLSPMTGVFNMGMQNIQAVAKIQDSIGDEQLVFNAVVAAVNHIGISNNATNNNPILESLGDDTNVGLTLRTQGTGPVSIVINGIEEYSFQQTLTDFKNNSIDNILYIMASGNSAMSGFIRMANGSSATWRNNAGDGDISLFLNANDEFEFQSDINATNHPIIGINHLQFNTSGGEPTDPTIPFISYTGSELVFDVPTNATFSFVQHETILMFIDESIINFNNQEFTDVGNLKLTDKLQKSQGPNVATPANGEINVADGNYIKITGTNNVNGIESSTWQSGSEVSIEVITAGGVDFIHLASVGVLYSSLLLPNATDITNVQPGEILTFIFDGTNWILKSKSF